MLTQVSGLVIRRERGSLLTVTCASASPPSIQNSEWVSELSPGVAQLISQELKVRQPPGSLEGSPKELTAQSPDSLLVAVGRQDTHLFLSFPGEQGVHWLVRADKCGILLRLGLQLHGGKVPIPLSNSEKSPQTGRPGLSAQGGRRWLEFWRGQCRASAMTGPAELGPQ